MNYKIEVFNEDISVKVQEHVFKLGYNWASGGSKPNYLNRKFLMIKDSCLRYFDSETEFNNSPLKEISITDFLRIKDKTVRVRLNSAYEAIVNSKEVKVGCQTFSHDKVQKLLNAVKEVNY